MSDFWLDSVVLITSSDPDKDEFGTGFPIYCEGQATYIVTCAHVVRDIGGPDMIKVADVPATLAASGSEDGVDLAVLRVEGLLDKPPLYLHRAADEEGKSFSTAGFERTSKDFFTFRRLNGVFGQQIQVGIMQTKLIKAWDLKITDDDYQLQRGNSGSPVVDESNCAVGIVNTRKGGGRMGMAISVEALEKAWPEMPAGLFVQGTDGPKSPLLHLVTNFEYLRFVQSFGFRGPLHWRTSGQRFPDNQSDTPVTRVSWNEAVAYCDWAGGCLPSSICETSTENAGTTIADATEIGEWHDAGTEQRKQVCNPHTSRLIAIHDRDEHLPNVGFHCDPLIAPSPPESKWVSIDDGRCQIGTDVEKFNLLADIYGLSLADRQPILRRQMQSYKVPGFNISATCVTNEEYYGFIKATGKKWPSHWDAKWLSRSNRPFPARLASRPVVNVSAEYAESYCNWSRTRLPTWLEWERAASGPARHAYPWGTDYSAVRCNSRESGRGSLAAVDEYSLGDSSEGVRQLCGNVWEWVLDPERKYEIRGGSYRMPCELWGLAYAFQQPDIGFHAPDTGFRVVID